MSHQAVMDAKEPCFLCPEEFNTLTSLKSHLALHHFRDELMSKSGSTVDKCGMCGRGNTNSANAELVMACHLAYTHMLLKLMIDKPFQNKIFHPRLPTSSKVKHKQQAGKVKKPKGNTALKDKLLCPLCPKKLKTLNTLKSHLAVHHFKDELLKKSGSSNHKCGICGKQYGTLAQSNTNDELLMTWHLAYTHKVLETMIPDKLKKQLFGDEIELKSNLGRTVVKSNKIPTNWKTFETVGTLKLMSGVINNIEESDKFQPKIVLENMKVEVEDINLKTPNERHPEANTVDTEFNAKHTCFLCAGNFATWRSLQSHLAQYHFKDDLLIKSDSSQYRCGICGRDFFQANRPKSRNDTIMICHLAFVHDLLRPLISHKYACQELDLAGKKKRRSKTGFSVGPRLKILQHKRAFKPRYNNKLPFSGAHHRCFICPSITATWNSFRFHVASHFRDELLIMSNSTKDKCGICLKQFANTRLDNVMTWHLAFKHSLLTKLIPENMSKSLHLSRPLQKQHLTVETAPQCEPLENRDTESNVEASYVQEQLKNSHKEGNAETDDKEIVSQPEEIQEPGKINKPLQSGPGHQCYLCSSTSTTRWSLRRHMAQQHFKDDLLKMSNSLPDTCGICGKNFGKPGHSPGRVDTMITWHLAFKHQLLKQLVPQSSMQAMYPRGVLMQAKEDQWHTRQPDQEDQEEEKDQPEITEDQEEEKYKPNITEDQVEVKLIIKEEDQSQEVFGGGKALCSFADLAASVDQRNK